MPPSPSWIICRLPIFKRSHYLHKVPIFGAISLVSFSTSTPKISIFDYLVNQHQFSPECASKVSSSSSSGEYLKKPRNTDSVLNFLKENGFANIHLETLVQKAPWILSANLERTVKPKMEIFQNLGFQSTDLADIVSAYPFLLRISADRLQLSVSGLKNILGPNTDICRLLKHSMSGRILAYDFSGTLLPNIEYFKNCGVCSLQIVSYVCRSPLFFLNKPEKLKGFIQRVDEMGVDRKSKMFLEAVRVISSVSRETWELKLKLFRDLGFSEQNISIAFGRAPQAFGASERKIKEATQLLLSFEDISYIARNPLLLSYSVEKRLKPRLRVLKALQSKNLLKKKPSLASFCRINDANFRNKYVIPYSNVVEDLYLSNEGS